jgi:iron complex transport system permease protein
MTAGAGLAVSGAMIQAVLANRLASPSLIGVNAGAGLAITICTAFSIFGGWQASLFSFLGAFAAVILITAGAEKWGETKGTLILAGVALNSFLNAISSAIVTLNPQAGVLSNDFKVGDFSAVTYAKLVPAAVITVAALVISFTLANMLDVMTLGEENAAGLGVNVKASRTIFLLLAALLAGAAVSIAGLLSFVGLIVPHAVRRLGARDCKYLLPLSALFGAGFVTFCDLIARTAFSPYEIPVGIIMAFIGAPFFILLLIKGKGGYRLD